MSKIEPKYSRKAVAAAKAPKYGPVHVLPREVTEYYNQRAAEYVAVARVPKKLPQRSAVPASKKHGPKRTVFLCGYLPTKPMPEAYVRVLRQKFSRDQDIADRLIVHMEHELASDEHLEECDGQCPVCVYTKWHEDPTAEGPEPERPELYE